jgi:UDP-N-acetylglucosamine 1-carboxyvinyltransferase
MAFIEIVGEKQLNGEVNIQGSKNAVLPILAATVLVNGISKINRCPKILDVFHMIKILEAIGCIVKWEESSVIVDTRSIHTTIVPEELVRKMRSSIILMGAMLGRSGEVTITYPGGCTIGKRPIDYHLDAFKKMNVHLEEEDGLIYCSTSSMKGADIVLKFPSVGATENIVLAAVLGKGATNIFGAAKEPEIIELCRYLNIAGAKIYGAGSGHIRIEGVDRLYDVEFTTASDRIVAGTYLAAVAGVGGEAVLKGIDSKSLSSVTDVLEKTGATIIKTRDDIIISSSGNIKPVPYLKTMPYPDFPTDMQSQMISVLMKGTGISRIEEDIFEGRYQNVYEQIKFGANIHIDDRIAIITGVTKLKGCDVYASELRGGAALVIAGLMAEGKTRIYNTNFIERGYEDIVRDLKELGATISYSA